MGCRFHLNLLLWRRKIAHYIDYYIPVIVKRDHLISWQNLLYTFFKQPIFVIINLLVVAIYWDIGVEITYIIQKAILRHQSQNICILHKLLCNFHIRSQTMLNITTAAIVISWLSFSPEMPLEIWYPGKMGFKLYTQTIRFPHCVTKSMKILTFDLFLTCWPWFLAYFPKEQMGRNHTKRKNRDVYIQNTEQC